ncbi:DUF2490 domain-containing protein [Bacteroides timonensis]|uniref:DUF2490 domain-containing protein n=1 Tax=Bacteroides timonensis TaxID=1470345 RepID=UPI0004B39252|nr:DUF2490 domain-containing protein [Bacteroides timonensis]
MKTIKNDILKRRALLPEFASLFVVLFFFCLSSLQAQDRDLVTWNKMKLSHDLSSRVAFSGDVEMRTRDAWDEIDRWGLGVGASVRLLSCLKAEGCYEFHYRNRGEDGWKSRHRYHAGVSLSFKKRQWTFSLRERFQHTFDGRGADEFRLRTRLKAAYKVTIWAPYASLEQYHDLGKDKWFHAARFRARGGVEAKLSSSWSADVFYCYQHESNLDRHILGWELIYRF